MVEVGESGGPYKREKIIEMLLERILRGIKKMQIIPN
jgi:hypothetical protein